MESLPTRAPGRDVPTVDHAARRIINRRARSGRRPRPTLTILAWHNIAPTPFFAGNPRAFERQLRLARRLGTPVSLAAAVGALREGRPLPRRAFAVTFDDGYRDNLDVAAPILGRLGIPATFFLVPGYLDRGVRCWWEAVAWAVARSPLTRLDWGGRVLPVGRSDGWHATAETICGDLKTGTHAERDAEITALIERLRPAGSEDEVARLFMDWGDAARIPAGIEVGSHTNRHAILARETPGDQLDDLVTSRHRLASELGRRVDLLAYPNGQPGDFDGATADAAAEAGYLGAVTTCEGLNTAATPPYELHRHVLSPRWGPGMVRYMAKIFLAARGSADLARVG